MKQATLPGTEPCQGYRICLRDLPTTSPLAGPIALPEGDLVGTEISFPVLCVRDLTRSHGVDITLARIDEMVAVYDPIGIRAAPLKLDHTFRGPGHGWADRIWRDGKYMWAHWIWLSDEVRAGISSRQWPYRSFEAALAHEITGGWYFTGCALLGADEPALQELPPIVPIVKASLSPSFVFQPGALAPQEERTMSKTSPAKPGAGAAAPNVPETPAEPATATQPQEPLQLAIASTAAALPTAQPAATPETEAPVAPPAEPAQVAAGAATAASVAAEVERLRSLNARGQAATEQIEAHAASLQAGKLLDALGSRVTPGMRSVAEPLLVELLAHENRGRTVRLSTKGAKPAEMPLWQAVVTMLSRAPEFAALDAEALADGDEAQGLALDNRTPQQRAHDERLGITAERYVELRRKGLVQPLTGGTH